MDKIFVVLIGNLEMVGYRNHMAWQQAMARVGGQFNPLAGSHEAPSHSDSDTSHTGEYQGVLMRGGWPVGRKVLIH